MRNNHLRGTFANRPLCFYIEMIQNLAATAYKQTTNKISLFRNSGYIETDYNKLKIPYYIMQQLVKQITLLIMVNSTKLILKSYETSYKIHFYFS